MEANQDIFEPVGLLFLGLEDHLWYKLVTEGPWKGWIVFKHPYDGRWVSLRQATEADLFALKNAPSAS